VQDRDGARPLLWALHTCFPRVRPVLADSGYSGQLVGWAGAQLELTVQIVANWPGRRPSSCCTAGGRSSARICEHLTEIMNRGTVTERKAAIETLIDEVQLTPRGAVPVFKISTDTTMPPSETDEGTRDEQPTVRTMVRSVELRGLEPLTPTLPVWCATSCATAPY
jgi:hypothetical protein